MAYSAAEIEEISTKVLIKIKQCIYSHNSCYELDEYLKTINCEDVIGSYNKVFVKNAKILVLGHSEIKPDHMRAIAKKMGIFPNTLELKLDYEKNERFNINKLRNNCNYSDIIIGPNAHKMVNIDGYSSVIAMIEDNASEFPKLTKAIANNKLKITKNSFENAIENTQAYRESIG